MDARLPGTPVAAGMSWDLSIAKWLVSNPDSPPTSR